MLFSPFQWGKDAAPKMTSAFTDDMYALPFVCAALLHYHSHTSKDAQFFCWGENSALGQPTLSYKAITSIDLLFVLRFFLLPRSAISKDAQVFCWGKDTGAGQPLAVPPGLGLSSPGGGVTQVTAGPDHAW
jgi:hypothetical protein